MSSRTLRLSCDITCAQCSSNITRGTELCLEEDLFFDGEVLGNNTPPGGRVIRCTRCHEKNVMCCYCGRIRKGTRRNIWWLKNNHHKTCQRYKPYHEEEEAADESAADENGCGENDDVVMESSTAEIISLKWDDFKTNFKNINSARYFFDEYREAKSGRRMGGIKGIVYRCINQEEHALKLADEETTMLHLDLLSLLHDLPESSKQKHTRLMKRVFRMHQARLQPGATVASFPLTHVEVHQRILRNKLSMSEQLPIERLQHVDNHHAYVSIDDVISLMMARGEVPLGWLQDEKGGVYMDGANGCSAARTLREELRNKIREQGYDPDKVAIGWVSPWSDGFVTSWVKQTKKGAWILTVTICMPGNSKMFRVFTHVVAMGPSSENHDEVIVHALKEIASLTKVKKRYCGIRNEWINTVFGLFVCLQDRPERHGTTYTNDGGTYAKRFSYTAFVDKELLPSCQACFISRLHRMLHGEVPNLRTIVCQLCCDWDYDIPDAPAWKLSARLPPASKYPTTALIDSSQMPSLRSVPESSHIRPQRMSFEWLIEGVAVAFYHLTLKHWPKYQSDNYLQTFGVSRDILRMCYEASKAAREELQPILDENERIEKVKLMMRPSELLRLKAIPEIWYLGVTMDFFRLECFIEIPMHHIFTGITKDFANLLLAILTKANQKAGFLRDVNKYTHHLGVVLRLSFCLPRKLPNKKWVSENYIAYSRMVPFMFGVYFNKYSPGVTNNDVIGEHVILLKRLVNAYNVLISVLMRPNQEGISRRIVDDVVKIFLSCLNDFDKVIGKSVALEIGLWTKQNPLSLLNLGQQIEKFGSLRFHWEGRNENKITDAKKDLNKMRLSLSFFQTKLQRIRRRVAISRIEHQVYGNNDDTDEEDENDKGCDTSIFNYSEYEDEEGEGSEDSSDSDDDGDADGNEESNWYRGYYRYQNVESLRSNFANGNFVSCFLLRSGGLFACINFKNKDQVEICEIRMEDDAVEWCCGSSFFRFIVTGTVKTTTLKQIKSDIVRNCLLIPLHERAGFFFAITDEWEFLTKTLKIAYPSIDGTLYEDAQLIEATQYEQPGQRTEKRRKIN